MTSKTNFMLADSLGRAEKMGEPRFEKKDDEEHPVVTWTVPVPVIEERFLLRRKGGLFNCSVTWEPQEKVVWPGTMDEDVRYEYHSTCMTLRELADEELEKLFAKDPAGSRESHLGVRILHKLAYETREAASELRRQRESVDNKKAALVRRLRVVAPLIADMYER